MEVVTVVGYPRLFGCAEYTVFIIIQEMVINYKIDTYVYNTP